MYIAIDKGIRGGQNDTLYINTDNVAKIKVTDGDLFIDYQFIAADEMIMGSLRIRVDDHEKLSMMTSLLTNGKST